MLRLRRSIAAFAMVLSACAQEADKCLAIPECRVERLATLAAKIEVINAKFAGELAVCRAQSSDRYGPLTQPFIDQQNAIRAMICKDAGLVYPDACTVDDNGKATAKAKP